jgi:hypothetical protein
MAASSTRFIKHKRALIAGFITLIIGAENGKRIALQTGRAAETRDCLLFSITAALQTALFLCKSPAPQQRS